VNIALERKILVVLDQIVGMNPAERSLYLGELRAKDADLALEVENTLHAGKAIDRRPVNPNMPE
jgi:hypothetical protein